MANYLFKESSFDVSMFLRKKMNMVYLMDENRKRYANAYKPWSSDDDERLLRLYREGKSIQDISKVFGRSEGAIQSRIEKCLFQ